MLVYLINSESINELDVSFDEALLALTGRNNKEILVEKEYSICEVRDGVKLVQLNKLPNGFTSFKTDILSLCCDSPEVLYSTGDVRCSRCLKIVKDESEEV